MAKYTDHHTRLKAAYIIEKKTDTLHTFCTFSPVAITLGLRVQRLRSHNGDKHISSSFRDYSETTRKQQQYPAPYMPQQNGILERDGRNKTDMTRCLLHQVNLPKHLWGELAATAAFLINLLPQKAIGASHPFQDLLGCPSRLCQMLARRS